MILNQTTQKRKTNEATAAADNPAVHRRRHWRGAAQSDRLPAGI